MAPEDLEKELHKGLDRLRGRLAGALEAAGLEDKQERALVSLMKSITYDLESSLVDLLYD